MSINFKKAAIWVTILTLLSKVFGFLREAVIAYFFGTSVVVDTYLMAVTIPTIVFGALISLSVAFTPLYTRINAEKGSVAANGFTNKIITVLILVCTILILLVMLFSKQVVMIAAPGFEGEALDMTSLYLKIAVWDTLFLSVLNIYVVFLQCNDCFIKAGVAMLFHSSCQIIFTIIAGYLDAIYLVVGYVFADIMYLLVAFVLSKQAGYKIKCMYHNRPAEIDLIKMAIPVFLSSTITSLNLYVDKAFASVLAEGSIAALNYSGTLNTFFIMMLNTGIITVIYPVLSRHIINNQIDEAKAVFRKSLRYIVIVFLPMTVGVLLLASPLVDIVFGRGAFQAQSIEMTANTLKLYSLGMLAIGLRDVIVKFFYSMEDSKTPLKISAINVVLNIILNFVLISRLGVGGIALATSVSTILTLPLYFILLQKRVGRIEKVVSFVMILKIVIACSLMGVCISIIQNYMLIDNFFSFGIVVIIGVVLYFVTLMLLKVEDLSDLLRSIKNKRS